MDFWPTKNGSLGSNRGSDDRQQAEPMPRRRLLGWLVGLINAGVAAAVVGPTLGFISAPLRRKKEPGAWMPVLDEAELAEGETKHASYTVDVQDGYMPAKRTYTVYLARRGGEVVGFDPTCPHLGCHVEYKQLKKRFVCPCHGGTFDAQGNRISGPPPRGLTKVPVKVAEGRIWVFKA